MLIPDTLNAPRLLNKELAVTTMSSLAFIITTVAITCLLIMQPQTAIAAFAILGAIETFSFITTIISLTSFRMRQQKELMQQQALLNKQAESQSNVEVAATVAINENNPVNLPEIVALSNDLEEILHNFPQIIAAGKTLLKTLIEQYYETEEKLDEKLKTLNEAFEILNATIEEFLKQPYEVMQMLVFTLIDEKASFLALNPTLIPLFQSEMFYALCKNIQTEDRQLIELINQVLNEDGLDSFENTLALLDYLFVQDNLPPDAQQEWIDELLPSLFQFWRVFYLNLIQTKMAALPTDLSAKGKFSTVVKLLLSGFVKLPQFAINKAIGFDIASRLNPFPLTPKCKEAFKKGGVMIGESMLEPSYHGLLNTNHPLRHRLDQIIHSEDFVPPEVEGTDWAAFTAAYTQLLESFTKKFKL